MTRLAIIVGWVVVCLSLLAILILVLYAVPRSSAPTEPDYQPRVSLEKARTRDAGFFDDPRFHAFDGIELPYCDWEKTPWVACRPGGDIYLQSGDLIEAGVWLKHANIQLPMPDPSTKPGIRIPESYLPGRAAHCKKQAESDVFGPGVDAQLVELFCKTVYSEGYLTAVADIDAQKAGVR
jgi:hypothetical protein